MASADNHPSKKAVRLYGKPGAGKNTGIDIYYVTNNNYDDFKLYDTKASHERGITFNANRYWAQRFNCNFLDSSIQYSIIVCANGLQPLKIDKAEYWRMENGQFQKQQDWGEINDNKGWTISNNSPGKECVRFDSKGSAAIYTAKPTRHDDTPACIVGVSSNDDGADTLARPALEADNGETFEDFLRNRNILIM